ncbi:calcium-binding protein [Jannaschia sp. M317]|uniref:calcium-binding protein n=1 Tax=Jannaschia sp. M317 TaxID=2867011 RepID=UPI0021FB4AF3|nr:hypothetical protein [Jannaschia sp. M317]UWQ19659.1 hypothetical protein K3551_18065 [Jannaschia sp. M317]
MTLTFNYTAHLNTLRFNEDWSEETATYSMVVASIWVPEDELRFQVPASGNMDGEALADHLLGYGSTPIPLSNENPTSIGHVFHGAGLETDMMRFDIHVRSGDRVLGFDTVYIALGGDPLPEFPSVEAFQAWQMSIDAADWWTPATTGPFAVGANVGWEDFDLPREIIGTAGDDTLTGSVVAETIRGLDGADTLIGLDGADTLLGGETAADLRDVIYGGAGDDVIDGGYGNDALRGDAGNDSIAGGFGADTVIGGTGNDTLTGSAFGDEIFGGDGMDFVNGGFGSDRVNGGADADAFFHLGIADHGSDWIQDYNGAEGDVLVYGQAGATRDQFQINTTTTPTAGADDVAEAFVIYRPTGQILWALVDGDGQAEINLRLNGQVFDLTA